MWIVGLKWWLFLPDNIPDKTSNSSVISIRSYRKLHTLVSCTNARKLVKVKVNQRKKWYTIEKRIV